MYIHVYVPVYDTHWGMNEPCTMKNVIVSFPGSTSFIVVRVQLEQGCLTKSPSWNKVHGVKANFIYYLFSNL